MANNYLCLSPSSSVIHSHTHTHPPKHTLTRTDTHTRNRHLEMNTIIFWTNWAQWKWINVFAFLCQSWPHAAHVMWMASSFYAKRQFQCQAHGNGFHIFIVSFRYPIRWLALDLVVRSSLFHLLRISCFDRIHFCSVSHFFFFFSSFCGFVSFGS